MLKQYKKLTATILIFSFLLISTPRPARADAWGTNMLSVTWKQVQEEIYLYIKETAIAKLKMMAIRIVQGKLETLLQGTPGKFGFGDSSLIIGDWKEFIFGSAQRYADTITNDFFSSMRSDIPSPLRSRVVDPAERALKTDVFSIKPDLHLYVREGRADKIFEPGWASNPWEAWRMAAMPQNDLAFTWLRSLALDQAAFEIESKAKEAEGTGHGFKSKKKEESTITKWGDGPYTPTKWGDGPYTPISEIEKRSKIVTPGSIIEDITAEIQKMPIKMITLARSIPDIVASLITQMLTKVIDQGLAKIGGMMNF